MARAVGARNATRASTDIGGPRTPGRNGDRIEGDIDGRRLHLDVAGGFVPQLPSADSGIRWRCRDHVEPADPGSGFDLARHARALARISH